MRPTACLSLVLVLGTIAPTAESAEPLRQYYGEWNHVPRHRYHYRTLHFKPEPSSRTYRRLICVRYEDEPRYVLLLQPNYPRAEFWRGIVEGGYLGRIDLEAELETCYSPLPVSQPRREDIDPRDYGPPGPMPLIPGSPDRVRLRPVPDVPTTDEGDRDDER